MSSLAQNQSVTDKDSRVSRMSRVCDQWSLQDLTDMTELDMQILLESYAPNSVPSLRQVRREPEEEDEGYPLARRWRYSPLI